MGLCKRCSAELQTALEEMRLTCEACFRALRGLGQPQQPAVELDERPFCCGSDPPCPSCPYGDGEGWHS